MLKRQQKIEHLLNYAKERLPEIQKTVNDQNAVKTRLIEDLSKHALMEYAPNRKTLSEYIEIVLLRLGFEC